MAPTSRDMENLYKLLNPRVPASAGYHIVEGLATVAPQIAEKRGTRWHILALNCPQLVGSSMEPEARTRKVTSLFGPKAKSLSFRPREATASEQIIRSRWNFRREILLSPTGAEPDILRGYECDTSASLFLPV